MSADCQFWWNWWVNFGVAIATVGAVLVALFGDWIKAKLFSPKLSLSLKSATGEKTTVVLQSQAEQGMQKRTEDARFYHLKVENKVKWPSANQLQVYLLRVEEPGPDGEFQITWAGEIPVQWTNQEIYPLTRTLGPAAYCDLCSIVKGKWIQLHPLIVPNNFHSQRRNQTTLIVTLQARCNEGESPIARFRIAWDGKWDDGDSEMESHLKVKDITEIH